MNEGQIASEALRVFWESVRKSCAHVLGKGSIPAHSELQSLAENAVSTFIDSNDRDRWTEIGTVIIIDLESNLPLGRKKLLGFVWGSDHDTFRTFANVRLHDWFYRNYASKQQKPVDPGLVRLDFVGGSAWFMQHGAERLRVKISAPANAWTLSVAPNCREGYLEVREIVEVADIPLMRIPMPPWAAATDMILSVTRLVAEINMSRFARSNWEECGGECVS